MSGNEINNTSNNPVRTQQNDLDLKEITQDSSNADIVENQQAQQNKIAELLKQSIKDFSTWSTPRQALAVSAASGLFAAVLPLLLTAVPLVAMGAMVGLALFFSVKAVQYGYKGLSWSAEKTVEGAKYTAGKIKAGTVYVKDKVKEGYEHSVDSLKRGSGAVKNAIGSALETVGQKISSAGEDMNTSYKLTDPMDTDVLLLTEDGKKEYNSIRSALRNISDEHLLEKISYEMVSLIDSKIESEKNMIDFQNKGNLHKSEASISRWIKQKNSIIELDPKGLQKRLSYEGYDHDLYQIFSEHHNEIKEVISKYKREYEFDQSVKRNNAKDAGESKTSRSLFKFPSPRGKGSMQSERSEAKGLLQEPFSSDLKMLDKTATVDHTRLRRSSSSSSYDGSPKPTPVALPEVPKNSARSSSPDSGKGSSGSSTPTGRQSLPSKEEFDRELKEKVVKLRTSSNKLPSSQVDVNKDVQQQNNHNQPHVK